MKRITLNETHIRQIVRETLENLILGEDDMENEDVSTPSLEEYINMLHNLNYDDWYVDVCDYRLNETYGWAEVEFAPKHDDRFDNIKLKIDFKINGEYLPYIAGDYYTPPEGGYYELNYIEITCVKYNMNDEYFGTVDDKKLLNYFSGLIETELGEKIETMEPSDWSDERYDAWRDDHLFS